MLCYTAYENVNQGANEIDVGSPSSDNTGDNNTPPATPPATPSGGIHQPHHLQYLARI
eukprot:TRINITY_DN8927_c0_g1_i1.p2 TRINITY_DN8927_c0_g1~~TRINITY_DN8927_c0_g1_i1.p2  ORF type:complete len:58 (+),score=6.48 TRINITY_DN8927_c0_g1_i1:153-326(+)